MTDEQTPQPTDASALVLLDVTGPIATVTLNDPATRNALSLQMMNSLSSTFRALGKRTDVRVIILQSTGHVFSSGHDLKQIRGAAHPQQQELFYTCSALMQLIQHIPQPVIAKVQGVATAAGCQLAATADLAVASEAARFATPGVNIGLFCSTPMVALSRAVPRKQAMRMLLTGEMISAEQAYQFGLVSHLAAATELDEVTLELARTISEASSATVSIGKRAFYDQISLSTTEAYAQTVQVMADNAIEHDAQEGIDAFLSKREPVWEHRGA
ncbi:enoyl-CoA hydratase [Brevibacterium sp. 50QC2O2]|uniref:enoyl-CoA hydratase n=1 Tax=Brevibacterium TaxID=1696 RepID=UPI00211BE1C8|nr:MULTISPECIES: enoyl-CoA hydratase [unclassified Brevibacterium]MCQ9368040.1 enoyl-CoA hydratase [Brevibacterium sp. 91QC2O2]MCQ9385242.1 enoyl-CoA hydratase [Brevibacterium sp. 68QC2CO]MCQ9388748.1 enoyl-CoA hydratase [Brevibacterium sp. 50QC2O2]